jgi:hypothetical protein
VVRDLVIRDLVARDLVGGHPDHLVASCRASMAEGRLGRVGNSAVAHPDGPGEAHLDVANLPGLYWADREGRYEANHRGILESIRSHVIDAGHGCLSSDWNGRAAAGESLGHGLIVVAGFVGASPNIP